MDVDFDRGYSGRRHLRLSAHPMRENAVLRRRIRDHLGQNAAQIFADTLIGLARFGDRQMILVLRHGGAAEAQLCAGFIHHAHAEGVSDFVIDHVLGMRHVTDIPLPQIAQVRVVGLQTVKARTDSQALADAIDHGRQMRTCMRRTEKHDGCGVIANRLPIRTTVIAGRTQHLLGKQATQTVANEDQRPAAQAIKREAIEHLHTAIRQMHAVPGITVGMLIKAIQTRHPPQRELFQQAEPCARTCGIRQSPHSDVGKLLRHPCRPEIFVAVTMLPGQDVIATEAVHEHDIGLALILARRVRADS